MPAFEDLTAPLGRAEFASEYWLSHPATLRPRTRLLEPLLLDKRMLSAPALIDAGHDEFRILPRKHELIHAGGGREALLAWKSELEVTLVAEYSQITLDSVRSFCMGLIQSIRVPFGWSLPNLYYSRPGSGFTRHWDNHENFIIGLSGTKRFLLAPNRCVRFPLQNADNYYPHVKGFEARIEAERIADNLPGTIQIDVGPGDCIFIPRGWWHEASALEGDSVTLTWAVWTSTWADLFKTAGIEPPEAAAELALRTPLPLSPADVPDDLHLPTHLANALEMPRVQAELLSIANVTKDWKRGLETGRAQSLG